MGQNASSNPSQNGGNSNIALFGGGQGNGPGVDPNNPRNGGSGNNPFGADPNNSN